MKKKFTEERGGPSTRHVMALLTAAATAALSFPAQAGSQQGKVVMHYTTFQASATTPGLAPHGRTARLPMTSRPRLP